MSVHFVGETTRGELTSTVREMLRESSAASHAAVPGPPTTLAGPAGLGARRSSRPAAHAERNSRGEAAAAAERSRRRRVRSALDRAADWATLGWLVPARIYVETSVPSFFFEERTEASMVARRAWTREWWAAATATSELVTSVAVVDELQRGDFVAKQQCVDLVAQLPLVAVDDAIIEIVQAYVLHKVMPADPVGDALHLALASYHRCDFLVTWNCKHIANANKFGHIRRVNALLGLYNPGLVTPLELLGGEGDED